MSRRDTIIVAVLVNAALLMVLFATAMRSDKVDKIEPKAARAELAQAEKTKPVAQHDLLNEYVTTIPTLAEPIDEEIASTEEMILSYTPVDEVLAPAAQMVKEPKFVNITVKQGDFLEKIARANNTTVTAIMQANNMSNTHLRIGQVLRIPLSQEQVAPARTPPLEDFYIVKDGDSPWLIANRNGIKLADLLRLNDLDETKARRIRPGDKLRIR